MKKLSNPLLAGSLFLLVAGFSCNGKGPNSDYGKTEGVESEKPQLAEQKMEKTHEELLEMGEHLVTTGGCEDCHSPKKYNAQGMPEPEQGKNLSGHPANLKVAPYDMSTLKNGWVLGNQHFTAWVGPWGTSFAANLTSDTATGIGNWTEEQFFRTLREGKYGGVPNGRMLLPPMPWPNIAKYTDEELRAIFTYLKSTKPIKNAVPAPIPPKGA